MRVRADSEHVETTRSEKTLAVVLAVFILTGGLWAYFKLNEVHRPPTRVQIERTAIDAADRAAVAEHQEARGDRRTAGRAVNRKRRELELRREAYRTALDAGEPADSLRAEYEAAQRDLADAEQRVRAAERQVAETADEAAGAQARIDAVRSQAAEDLRNERRSHDRLVFALRLALVLAMLGGGYWLLGRMRSRRSRYLPLALAEIGAGAALALVMGADYMADRIDVEEFGPLALSVAGIAMTVVAFVALQRYVARRIPLRRVRRHECPFCGHPVRENSNCEGCGRKVIGECSVCHEPRRVATAHCGACGSA